MTRLLIRLALLGCLCVFAHADEIDALVGHPFAESIAGDAPSGRVAWVQREQGRREIWTWCANTPEVQPVRLAEYQDDGQSVEDLHFSSDGKRLAYVRGDVANPQGFNPNPGAAADGTEQAVWLLDFVGGSPTRIGIGGNPAFSPDGRKIAWIAEGKLFLRAVDAAFADEPKPAFKQRGRITEFRWAPDGMQITFVSERGNHSFIGLFRIADRALQFLDPSVDRDIAPRFSQDSKRVAFIRWPGLKNGEGNNVTVGLPFAIEVVDLTNGAAREIWRSKRDDGGFAQWGVRDPLLWAGNDSLVFSAESDGWLRLWRIRLNNDNPVAITPPNCMVEDWSASPDARQIIATGNCATIDGRQLLRIDTDSGKSTTIAGGEAIQTDPIYLGPSRYAYRSAGARAPSAAAFGDGNKRRLLSPRREAVLAKLVEPEIKVVHATDGLSIHLQVFDAKTPRSPRAALIFVHGGPMRQMLPGFHYMSYYHQAYAMNQVLAREGYVVVSVNYRASIGYGKAFREAPNQGPRGASEYQDVLAGLDYLLGRGDVDPKRVGIWGGSYGGLLTAQALSRDSDKFAVGVDFHGVHDWSQFGPQLNGGDWNLFGEATLKLAHDSSPVATIEKWRSPVLLIHGDDDPDVPFSETVDLAQRLRAQNVETKVLVFPDDQHEFLLYRNWITAYRAMDQFLSAHLGP